MRKAEDLTLTLTLDLTTLTTVAAISLVALIPIAVIHGLRLVIEAMTFMRDSRILRAK